MSYINLKLTFIGCCLLQLEGRLKKKEPEEQKIKEEVDEKVQVKTYLLIHQMFSLTQLTGLNASHDQIFPSWNWGLSNNISQFSELHLLWNYLKDNKHKSLHVTLKVCLDICLWTCLFLKADSFPQAKFSWRTVRFSEE